MSDAVLGRTGPVLSRLGVAAVGAWTGVVGALAHRLRADVGGVDVAWGLVATLVVTALVAVACEGLVRVGAAWCGLGWTLVLLGQQLGGSGSYLVAGDGLGWWFMGGGLGVFVAVLAVAPRLER